jgi:hypothetical protein
MDGVGAGVTVGEAFALGTPVLEAAELFGAVTAPRAGGVPAGEKTMNPPISSPTAAPASPSRN